MKQEGGFTGIAALVFILLALSLGGCLFDYSWNFWYPELSGKVKDLPFYVDMLGGLVLSGFLIPIAIITLIASFVI